MRIAVEGITALRRYLPCYKKCVILTTQYKSLNISDMKNCLKEWVSPSITHFYKEEQDKL